ncbi:MAG TPA: HD domain-containing phosphohydrolase, partial [Rhodocyclaceae bacterium]|nr:HD domain-containing phosphohydrolase [Rhodocyclaceae bacterium]
INAMPESELLAAVLELRSTSILVTAFIILFAAPIAWSMARLVTRPLRALVFEAEAIRRFEFKNPIEVKSLVLEVHELGTTMADMKRTIHRFLDISRAVALEDNFDRLLPMLLKETLSAANADAGVLYLVDGEQLIPVAAMRGNDTFEERLASISTAAAGPLFSQAVQTGTSCSAELGATDIEIGGLGGLFANGAIKHGLAVPLLNRRQQLVGAMLLLRRTPIDSAQISFIKALTGSAATSLETRELIKAQKELFEALIHLIASAIDAKSHYTAGHCERVPEIAKLLARAACDDMSGVFKDFKLDDAEWESLHVAAWLHDCGKITTPEYVVDKATKLETIYDRIHEIRMRFEVLKRDAEIASLKAVANGADEERARALLVGELTQLDDDYRFVALCNEGGEFMAPDKVEHLRQIANRTWLRTLDDRLGLSHEERERKSYAQPSVLPAIEKLLADKPEHIIERRAQDRLIDNGKWGFRMETPPNLYNRGELYNLSISRGTLAEEERYKINEHIMQTLIMLSKLPFPKHLRQVPEIAGGHHEKMNGTGYPKRLTKDEMSVLARIMAIADIFEALTAVDRPYKKGKTLSETIKIMSFMAKDAHIDADLFALFLRSGAYLDYAEKYMQKEQIDTVDVERHLSI